MKIESSNIHKLFATKITKQSEVSNAALKDKPANLSSSFVKDAVGATNEATRSVRQLAERNNVSDNAVKEVGAEVLEASNPEVKNVEALANFLAERIVSNPKQAIAAQANISQVQVGEFLK